MSPLMTVGEFALATGLSAKAHAAELRRRRDLEDRALALAAAGVQAQDLADNGKRIPSEVHERLLAHLLEVSGDPLFGLHAARFVQPGSWSVLGYIAMNCATLGEAMGRIVPYEKLVGDMGTSRLEMAGDHVRLIWNCRHESAGIRRHMVENVLASWMLYARWIADMDRSPREVWLEHERPAEDDQVGGAPRVLPQRPEAGEIRHQDERVAGVQVGPELPLQPEAPEHQPDNGPGDQARRDGDAHAIHWPSSYSSRS